MIGRKKEIEELNTLYEDGRAELVAVYGRRRVGKTYLIDETFGDRFTFRCAGLSPAAADSRGMLQAQLDNFYKSLLLYGMEPSDKPKSWMDAFFLLEMYLQKMNDGSRQLVFLDELPWMDTPRSNFLIAFESFWNNWACHRHNLMVIVCGSANSWILDNLINNHGGLYNRVTYEIKLSPFTLAECEQFYAERNVSLSRYEIAESYMVFGGIPYYLGYVNGKLSLAQNIDAIFFANGAKLRDEFHRLFSSLFVNPEAIEAIVNLLGSRNAGFTRKEIAERLKISDSGQLSTRLRALLAGDFIVKYVPFGFSKREVHYKLTDPFCLFYLRFMNDQTKKEADFWEANLNTQQIVVWRGLAFENLCFNHIDQIKEALGIAGVATSSSAWSKKADDEDGTQINLLLSRADNVVNMCEIKFYSDDFSVDKDYYRVLLRRQALLSEQVSRKTSVRSTLITTFGLKHNAYSGAFTNVITLEELFK